MLAKVLTRAVARLDGALVTDRLVQPRLPRRRLGRRARPMKSSLACCTRASAACGQVNDL
ncbi:MAG TPA: hypothetical protein VK066_24610 [Chloroflexota bacterium]|nr:hypothetical protein [Chloroflexota bacterium]